MIAYALYPLDGFAYELADVDVWMNLGYAKDVLVDRYGIDKYD